MGKKLKKYYATGLVVLSTTGSIVAIITSLRGCSIAKGSLEATKDANKTAKEALNKSERSSELANEANQISREISGITNRPYVLYVNTIFAYGDFREDNAGKSLKIFHNFTLVNKGTLPAWIYDYSFYVSGKDNESIHVPYTPNDKPSSNFALGQDNGGESRSGWFSLIQKHNEKGGHVDSFLEKQNKFILLVTKYKTLGRELDNKDFSYWELYIFKDQTKAYLVEAGTSLLTEADVESLFQRQDKRFSENNAV